VHLLLIVSSSHLHLAGSFRHVGVKAYGCQQLQTKQKGTGPRTPEED
jgi:hypothetical protein